MLHDSPISSWSSSAIDSTEVQTLRKAISKRNVDLCHKLLLSGADPNEQDRLGHTLLMHAVVTGVPMTCRLLLEFGADPNIPSHRGFTPLYFAVRRESEILLMLLEQGADPSILGDGVEGPYNVAKEKNDKKVCGYIDTYSLITFVMEGGTLLV